MSNGKKNRVSLIKRLWWDFRDKEYWHSLVQTLLEVFPGESGKLLRGRLWEMRMIDCGANLMIARNVNISHPERIKMGCNVRINCGCYIDAAGGIEFGDNVLIGPGVKIWSVSHAYKNLDQTINEQGYFYRSVRIGNDVWLGANTVILPGANIPDKVVIGASGVVNRKKLMSGGIYIGNPLKKIGIRSSNKRMGEDRYDFT